jgi:hypothetical protein
MTDTKSEATSQLVSTFDPDDIKFIINWLNEKSDIIRIRMLLNLFSKNNSDPMFWGNIYSAFETALIKSISQSSFGTKKVMVVKRNLQYDSIPSDLRDKLKS